MKFNRPLNSIYIHIPFCKDKCYYCNFVSFVDKIAQIESYITSLTREIEDKLRKYPDKEFKTIYIGGGTPSLIEIKYYEIILSKIYELARIAENAEITIEVNPSTVTLEYLKGLKSLGINRLSIGVQSFNDDILKLLNRIHNKTQAIETVHMAKKAGFDNISLDLIYGLPQQNIKIWEETLNMSVNLDIQHISAYGLKIEDDTKFAKNLPPDLPDEETSALMYCKTIDILAKHDFEHYEISNFAKSGYESRHNLSYWNNEEYLGFGLAAHGYENSVRYSNICNFNEYLRDPLKKDLLHEISKKEAVEEGIFLGLRLIQGINIEKFNREYGMELLEDYKNVIKKYVDSGHIEVSQGNLRLNVEGILISNTILADFLD